MPERAAAPPPGGPGRGHQLIGRDAEQAAILRLIAPPLDGLRGLLLEGDAGIGKTSLWRAAQASATAQGFRLLVSTPTDAEVVLPYAVLGDLLDPLPEDSIALLSQPLRNALEVALFRTSVPEGATDQLAVCTAFLRVLRSLASEHAVLLAVDDLQWVDAPSRRVLNFAIRRLEQGMVRVIATRRASSPGAADPDWYAPPAGGGFERVWIGPLSLDAIDKLLLERLARPLRRPELDRVYRASGGNPFFALEIGRFLIERPSSAMASEPLPLPRSLTDAIQARVAKLPPVTRDLLVAVAAMSHPSDGMLKLLEPDAMTRLEAAIAADVVERSEDEYRFTHPLLASVAYSLASSETRRRWHARLAEITDDPEQRARHVALSADGPEATIAAALEDAARSANARGAPDAAATLAEEAAQLTPAELTRDLERRRVAGAGYRLRSGDLPGARRMLEELISSAPASARPAEALRLLGNIAFSEGDLVEAERLLNDALALANADDVLQAIIERDLVRAVSQRGDLEGALGHARRIAEIAVRVGDSDLAAMALRLRSSTGRHHGLPMSPEARELAMALADGKASIPADDTPGVLHPLLDWAALLKWSDDFARARILFTRVLMLTDGRDESLRAPVLFHLAELECWAGDWEQAAVYAEECEKAVLHTGQQAYRRLSLVAHALLACLRGDLDRARQEAGEAVSIARSVGDDPYLRRALAILGATELAGGDAATANGHFEQLRERIAHKPGSNGGLIRSEGDEVEALLAIGRRDRAEEVTARLAVDERVLGDPWPRTIGARCRALLAAAEGDLARSQLEFEATLIEHGRLPMPYERARTLFAYAGVLRRRKRKRAARAALEEARAVFSSLGAAVWVKRSEAELSRISSGRVGADLLTPNESRVAALVASGQRNREVADQLFLSVKTVEAHLSRIYGKLGVRSRSELVARIASER